jgi:hypothetical protein
MADEQQQESKEEAPATTRLTWREFLESFPLNSVQLVSDYYALNPERSGTDPFIRLTPILRLFCSKCEGIRNFSGKWQGYGTDKANNYQAINAFLQYGCRDCGVGQKTFCLRSAATEQKWVGYAIKIGEFPEVHVELPRSLKSLLGDDYELFLKGLQCEKQGLGVGAFVYYRRVVESQKGQLIGEILRVVEKLNAPQSVRDTLSQATKEKQFSRAVEALKDAIAQALLVDSHNPLKLLHEALSIGVHAETDESCLKIAHGVRMVLADFSERLKLALEDQSELRGAIAELGKFIGEARKKSSS